jgi:ubiquinone/menaquinone biosynthesis C-methylase UbiE
MKIFDSGMPEEAYWNSLFDIKEILAWLNLKDGASPIAEIGCGYGTFTVPFAGTGGGVLHAFDIDPVMLERARLNVESAGAQNVEFHERDVLEQGTGLDSESMRTVLLFNILHSAENRLVLMEASRVLQPSGSLFIIHWRKDITTPRGPRMARRPDLDTVLDQAGGLDLFFRGNSRTIAPYHWGMQLVKGDPDANRNTARDK